MWICFFSYWHNRARQCLELISSNDQKKNRIIMRKICLRWWFVQVFQINYRWKNLLVSSKVNQRQNQRQNFLTPPIEHRQRSIESITTEVCKHCSLPLPFLSLTFSSQSIGHSCKSFRCLEPCEETNSTTWSSSSSSSSSRLLFFLNSSRNNCSLFINDSARTKNTDSVLTTSWEK